MSPEYLFVYGSLRRGCDTEMAHLLRQESSFAGEASLQGKMYRVADFPGVVDSKTPDHRVAGEVVRLNEPRTILALLDAYEGCEDLDRQRSPLYKRERRTATLSNGSTLECWVYLYARAVGDLSLIESGDFLADSDSSC